MPKIFKKSENRESIKAKGEYFGCTFSYVLEVLKEIKNDLEKIKVEFEFCAEASGLIDDWVYYDSKSDFFDINFDDNF